MKPTGVAAVIAASLLACGEGKGIERSSAGTAKPGGTGAGGQAPAAPAPEVDLAAAPRIDLLHNRHRFHLYRDGLLLPLASEGMRKYTQ